MTYYIIYNAKLVATRSSLAAAKRFVERKGYRNDEDNVIYLTDEEENEYQI